MDILPPDVQTLVWKSFYSMFVVPKFVLVTEVQYGYTKCVLQKLCQDGWGSFWPGLNEHDERVASYVREPASYETLVYPTHEFVERYETRHMVETPYDLTGIEFTAEDRPRWPATLSRRNE